VQDDLRVAAAAVRRPQVHVHDVGPATTGDAPAQGQEALQAQPPRSAPASALQHEARVALAVDALHSRGSLD